jgi:putative copper resistance protein D
MHKGGPASWLVQCAAYPFDVPSDNADHEAANAGKRAVVSGRGRGRPAGIAALVVAGTLLAMALAMALTTLSAADAASAAFGLPDPGTLTRYGLPVVTVLAEVGAVVCVGCLLFAAFFVPPQRSGVLAAGGYAAVRTASWAAAVWFLGAALTVPFTIADAVGKPVGQILNFSALTSLTAVIAQAGAWALTAGLAFVLALACRAALSWGWTATLFAIAVLDLVPVAVTGHSSSGGAHDVATDSLLYHLVGVSLWVGGLVAVVAHVLRRGDHLSLAVTRFSRLALVCWLVMAVSGTINALVRLPLHDVVKTTYGALVLGKVGALLVLGLFGYLHRRRSVRDIVRGGSSSALLRLGAVEVLVMLATVGLATALSRTPPPPDAIAVPGRVELAVGYNLPGAPTLARLLFDWRFDLIYGTAAIVLGALYLVGVRRLSRRGDTWPVGRTVAWLAGCATVLLATSSGIGLYAPAMFSVHMGEHMLLSMFAPVLLVLGGPVTLALRALPAAGGDAPPGPREWLLAFMHSPLARVLTHPLVALALFAGSFYGLYFSGLFDAALNSHWAHVAMNAHFLLAGYVFYWPVIGVDPAPRRLPHLGRLGLMFAAMPFHAFFGIILMSSQTVIGENFYRGLALPWVSDALADQRLGGGLAWASGEVPVLLVVIALLVQWSRTEERAARRDDRRADADGDADLAAYNAMLQRLAGRGPNAR